MDTDIDVMGNQLFALEQRTVEELEQCDSLQQAMLLFDSMIDDDFAAAGADELFNWVHDLSSTEPEDVGTLDSYSASQSFCDSDEPMSPDAESEFGSVSTVSIPHLSSPQHYLDC